MHLFFDPMFHEISSGSIDMLCRLLFLVACEWSSNIEQESDSDDELAELYPLFSRYVQQHIGALTPKATEAGNGGTVLVRKEQVVVDVSGSERPYWWRALLWSGEAPGAQLVVTGMRREVSKSCWKKRFLT